MCRPGCKVRGTYSLAKDVLDVAQVALQVNMAKEGQRLPCAASRKFASLG
jgi:hypothetical protein